MIPLPISCTLTIQNAVHLTDQKALTQFTTFNAPYSDLLFVVWHWKVPNTILQSRKCYGMHTGPLLKGRGKGPSPIKNLLAKGCKWTTVCVFEMTPEFDAGKVLLAIPMSLGGTEEDILQRIDKMIPVIQAYLNEDDSNIPLQWTRLESLPS